MKQDEQEWLMGKVTEILIISQFKFWVDKQGDLTAEEINSRNARAIAYYYGDGKFTPFTVGQTRFHAIIDMQRHMIANVLAHKHVF